MDRLVDEAVSLATTSGMLMSKKGDADHRHTSFTLYPSAIRRIEYDEGHVLTPILNRLTMTIARDYDFLRNALRETARADENFTGRLLRMLDEKHVSRVEFTLNRYDFFANACTNENTKPYERGLKLIELNCIAAGVVTQAGLTTALHRMLYSSPASQVVDVYNNMQLDDMPRNETVHLIAASVATAHKHYVRVYDKCDARIIMIVEEPYVNACDQNMLRWRVWTEHRIDFLRITLPQLAQHSTIASDGTLIVREFAGIQQFSVSVAYFRTGYMPYEYRTEQHWHGRTLIERSNAVSCPSVAMQLMGMKKMQQVLGEPNVLGRYLDESEAMLVRSTLVKQFDLTCDSAVQCGIENMHDYVLKPQREGGGNNLYREQLRDTLVRLKPKQRAAYVLMERIHSTAVPNVLVRNGKWEFCEVVSELGFYGGITLVDGEIVENKVDGQCLKSKKVGVDDGGIIVGVAVLDSPRLVDSLEL